MRLHLKLWFDLLRQPPTRPIAPGSKLIPRPSKIFAAAATKRFLLLEERTFLEVVDATTGSWLHTGKTARAILAHLPGGDLELSWPDDRSSVFMTGPATEVFSGEWLD